MNLDDRFSTTFFEIKDDYYHTHTFYKCITCGSIVDGPEMVEHHQWHSAIEEYISENGRWVKAFMEWKDLVTKGVRM